MVTIAALRVAKKGSQRLALA